MGIKGEWDVKSSETGVYLILLDAVPSEHWIEEFLEKWEYERQRRSNTLEPLGEVEIVGDQIRIKEPRPPRLNSEAWQKPLALQIIESIP